VIMTPSWSQGETNSKTARQKFDTQRFRVKKLNNVELRE
jgi:hypothetical protein